MAYATQQNCIDMYGEDDVIVATDRDGDGVIDTAVLSKALDNATTIIDSYVSGLPGYPFDPVPDIFESLCCEIAIYKAASTAHALTEEMRTRYEDALKYLTLVGQQKIRLSVDDGEGIVEPNSTATITSNEREIDRTSLNRLM